MRQIAKQCVWSLVVGLALVLETGSTGLAEPYRAKSGEPLRNKGAYVISSSDCALLRRHEPRPDVTYGPGAPGFAAVETDPRPDFNEAARNARFAVYVDVDGRLVQGHDGIPVPGTSGAGRGSRGVVLNDTPLAVIELRDGIPYMDGLPLASADVAAVHAACGEVLVSEPFD